MKIFAAASLLLLAAAPAHAQGLPPLGGPYPPPFTATLSNNTPLAFGMGAIKRQRHVAAERQPADDCRVGADGIEQRGDVRDRMGFAVG